MDYLVEFWVTDDPSTFVFEASSLVNVILGLTNYEDHIGDIVEVALYPIEG